MFSERLRQVRIKAGESQKKLGELLDVSPSQISDMESGRRGTTIEKLALICRHYHVSADYLLGLSDEC
ncbi:helix-turn-helix transcriptional regulator [Pseudoflavonifractor phocaeensis]|uniref:helix-turn-helix domain-containing protein n=1 Tax=Pseudoflavonifractor phocaeensis TaxID=1870988 RepID=UPI00313D878B